MGHYDSCREGYCHKCGAAPGNIINGKCEFCHPIKSNTKYYSIDDLLVKYPNLYEAVQILIRGVIDNQLSDVWYKWDEARHKDNQYKLTKENK